MRRDDFVRRRALFHPLLECGDGVEPRGPGATSAVLHARHQEQAVEVVCAGRGISYALVVIDAVERCDIGIAPSVIVDQLAAIQLERAQVRIRGVEDGCQFVIEELHVVVEAWSRFEFELAEIPFGILKDDVLEERNAQVGVPARTGFCAYGKCP